jgi:hypothetical protein
MSVSEPTYSFCSSVFALARIFNAQIPIEPVRDDAGIIAEFACSQQGLTKCRKP